MKQQSDKFESARKARAIADVNVHCKMTSVITLDGVIYTCQHTCETVQLLQDFFNAVAELEEAEDFNVF